MYGQLRRARPLYALVYKVFVALYYSDWLNGFVGNIPLRSSNNARKLTLLWVGRTPYIMPFTLRTRL